LSRLCLGDQFDNSNHEPDGAAVAQRHVIRIADSNSVTRAAPTIVTVLRVRFERRYPHPYRFVFC
jgi:hypothetical protein